jgi:hypothetical protein
VEQARWSKEHNKQSLNPLLKALPRGRSSRPLPELRHRSREGEAEGAFAYGERGGSDGVLGLKDA